MKPFSLSKLLTFVSILLVGSMGWGDDSNPFSAFGGPEAALINNQQRNIDSCNTRMSDMNKAKSTFLSTCQSTGLGSSLKECSETLDDCNQNEDEDLPLTVGLFSYPDSGSVNSNNRCSGLSYADYKSDLRDLQSMVKDNKRELRDLLKQKNDDAADATEKSSKIQEEFAQLQEDKNEADMKAAEDERDAQAKQKDTLDQLKAKLRELQTRILTTQNAKAQLLAKQASDVDDYKISILNCKAQTKEYYDKLKLNKSAGSFSAAQSRGSTTNKDIQTYWQSCVNKVLKTRDAQNEAYRAKASEYDNDIANAQQEMTDVQQSLAMLAQQAAQAAQDRANKKQQDEQVFMQKRLQKLQDLQNLQQQMQIKAQENAQQIAEAQASVTSANNDLSDAKKDKPKKGAKKTFEDASVAIQAYQDLECKSVCSLQLVGPIKNAKGDILSPGSPNLKDSCDNIDKKGRSGSGSSRGAN